MLNGSLPAAWRIARDRPPLRFEHDFLRPDPWPDLVKLYASLFKNFPPERLFETLAFFRPAARRHPPHLAAENELEQQDFAAPVNHDRPGGVADMYDRTIPFFYCLYFLAIYPPVTPISDGEPATRFPILPYHLYCPFLGKYNFQQ